MDTQASNHSKLNEEKKKKRYPKRNGLDGKQDKRDSGADRSK